jgi:hypothetical protein
MYYGEHLASTGRAITITLNDQNVGIIDVRLAFEWVADNSAIR